MYIYIYVYIHLRVCMFISQICWVLSMLAFFTGKDQPAIRTCPFQLWLRPCQRQPWQPSHRRTFNRRLKKNVWKWSWQTSRSAIAAIAILLDVGYWWILCVSLNLQKCVHFPMVPLVCNKMLPTQQKKIKKKNTMCHDTLLVDDKSWSMCCKSLRNISKSLQGYHLLL